VRAGINLGYLRERFLAAQGAPDGARPVAAEVAGSPATLRIPEDLGTEDDSADAEREGPDGVAEEP
jgi:hypothetical protein